MEKNNYGLNISFTTTPAVTDSVTGLELSPSVTTTTVSDEVIILSTDEYPDIDDFHAGIATMTDTDSLVKLLKNVYKGKSLSNMEDIKTEWYRLWNKWYSYKKHLSSLQKDLEVTDDVDGVSYEISQLKGYTDHDQDGGDDITVPGKIAIAHSELTQLESAHPWLYEFRDPKQYDDDFESTVPTPDIMIPPKELINQIIRVGRNSHVRSLEKTVSDQAKMISLLMSMSTIIYESQPYEVKSSIPAQKKAIVETAIRAFDNVVTRADQSLQTDGMLFIHGLMHREHNINEIAVKIINQFKPDSDD